MLTPPLFTMFPKLSSRQRGAPGMQLRLPVEILKHCIFHFVLSSRTFQIGISFRSDEDWRTLFDTLYEDRAATEASQAKAVAPTPTNASAAVGACRDYPP